MLQPMRTANLKQIFGMIRQTYSEYSDDRVSRLSASLAYYTVFCIAPLLVIVVRVAAVMFGQAAAKNQLSGQLQGLLGSGIAGAGELDGDQSVCAGRWKQLDDDPEHRAVHVCVHRPFR